MRAAPPAKTSSRFFSSQSKNVRVADQSDLGHLRIAGAELALRQRIERISVGKHQRRLHERADEVLAMSRVDAGLAADA